MSGIEALGVAASIIQVADLGTKLSVKLFSFYRQVKNANESIQLLSNEVALISAILHELGDSLEEEESANLCSDEAFLTLERVLDQCRDVLRQIERVVGINDLSSKTRLQQVTGKIRLVLLEPSLEPLKANLERLKSTMLLLLNVIMFAGQVRNNDKSILQEQRALIESLIQEKEEDGGEPFLPKHNQDQHILKSNTQNPSKPVLRQSNEFAEVEEYNVLIRKMLCAIDSCKSKLENSRHSRLTHGHSVLQHVDKSLLVDENDTSEPPAVHDNGLDSTSTLMRGEPSALSGTPAENDIGSSSTQMTETPLADSTPGSNVQNSSAGHDSPKMDGELQQYIPNQHPLKLPPPPPPPPRHTPAQLQTMVPPSPPGPPPRSEQSWGRQALTPGENEPLTSATYIPGGQSVSHGIDLIKAPGHRHNVSDASLGGLSPSEADDQWPLSRVLLWLRKNRFSKEWQETFKSLVFQGAEFLELGLAFGGRGRLIKMHRVVYPELAKECARSGTGWDPTHEREEGRRMRKLIRQIHDGLQDASFSTPMRETSVPVSAEDRITLFSCPSPEPRSASPIDRVNDITADQLAGLQSSSSGQAQKQSSENHSITMPLTSGHESLIHGSPSRESPSCLRSDYSRNALATISDHRLESPLPLLGSGKTTLKASKTPAICRKPLDATAKKGPGERNDLEQPPETVQVHDPEVVFASVGRMGSAIGTQSSSVPVPRSPFTNRQASEAESEPEPELLRKSDKPTLKLDTNFARRVTFRSPNTTSGENITGPSTHSYAGHFPDSKEQPTGDFTSPVSPGEERLPRRNSFFKNVWGTRSPVESIIQNLDDFFPTVDLDAPYLGKPPSPNNRDILEKAPESPVNAITVKIDETDSSHVRQQPGVVAMRDVGHNGSSPSRLKSIREIARGSAQRTKNTSSAGPSELRDLRGHKTTKMFGARIMQINPKPGDMYTAAQPTSSQSVPQRQPTFGIIRGQLIGKGTYGRTYLAINANNGEVLAVKQVEINARVEGTDRDYIMETGTMQHLEHPNIVQYLGYERDDLSSSIYLEYVSGGSIGSYLRVYGKFEESVVKSLIRQTLSGLAYLHDKGVLHRNMKADNILLDLNGICKISDFGIAKRTEDIYGDDLSNSTQGSVFWMAPEVIQSRGQGYSAKADIWSLGCVVLEMFAGHRPWTKEEAIGTTFKTGCLNQAPPIPDDVSMKISTAALAFMYDCLTMDPSTRPSARGLQTNHTFCEPDPTFNYFQTDLFAKLLRQDITRPETIEYVDDKYQELHMRHGSSDGKLRAERDERGHETEQKSHSDSPLAMNTSIRPSEGFEELLLRWTKLGRNEIRALGEPISQV